MKHPLSLIVAGFLLGTSAASAQHYVRTRHNAGLTLAYIPFDMTTQSHLKPLSTGTAISAGITKEWHDVFYPEVFFVHHNGTYGTASESSVPAAYTWNGAGAGILFKPDLFIFNTHKRGGMCFGRVANALLGADYVQPFLVRGLPNDVKAKGELGLKAGIGMYSIWGGSSKKHQSWTIHYEAFARYGMSPFMTHSTAFGNEAFHHLSIGLTMRVIHHKVYKFSEM